MRRISRMMSALGLVAAGALALTACSGGGATGSGAGAGTTYHIGISQLVQHPGLDAAAEGFQRAITEAGLAAEFDVQNANGEQATATTIAQGFATSNKDLVLAITTPSAQAAAQAITNVPVLFTAVTDPVAAELVASEAAPGGNLTGTTDMNPVADQIALLKEIVPTAKSVGIIYSTGEVNAQVQVELARQAAAGLGIEIKEATVTSSGEVATAAESLGAVDAIYIPTDNRVVEGFESVVQYAESKQIPLFGSESSQVDRGAIATLGIDYGQLGYQTGQMAVRILSEGADPATMPIERQSKFLLAVNPGAAGRMGVTIPSAVTDRADSTVTG